MSLEDAVEQAICECIEEGILKEFLEQHRAEAKAMSIFEYDQEKHLRMEREEAWEEGQREGLRKGRESGLREGRKSGLREGRKSGLREGRETGLREGEENTKRIFKLFITGKTPSEIAEICEIAEEKVRQILE